MTLWVRNSGRPGFCTSTLIPGHQVGAAGWEDPFQGVFFLRTFSISVFCGHCVSTRRFICQSFACGSGFPQHGDLRRVVLRWQPSSRRARQKLSVFLKSSLRASIRLPLLHSIGKSSTRPDGLRKIEIDPIFNGKSVKYFMPIFNLPQRWLALVSLW